MQRLNPVVTNYCNADYNVRHLNENETENENNKTTKPVQTLKAIATNTSKTGNYT